MLNPLTYTENIVRSFLRYQLTAYPFADTRLNEQMRRLLSLEHTRQTPLLKGPYISLSRVFKPGARVDAMIREGLMHPHLQNLIPFPRLHGHQEEAIRAIHQKKHTLVSTGTGSGKSECFLYPIISRCLELRDQNAPPGICAVLVYPMNALAEDQLGRLRELLAGTGIPFAMYVGKTPDRQADVTGKRLPPGTSREVYKHELEDARRKGLSTAVHPPEEICSREAMRATGGQPRILLTNVKQMELLLTRHQDVELFEGALLDYLVFDEAHTFSGAQGAETACLIRRLRSFCRRAVSNTVCIATSATIADSRDPQAASNFASRFFGVPAADVITVQEVYEEDAWNAIRQTPAALSDPRAFLDKVRAVADQDDGGASLRSFWASQFGETLPTSGWEGVLFDRLAANELLYQAAIHLAKPANLAEVVVALAEKLGRKVTEEELIAWLMLGVVARRGDRPLVRPIVHAFVRGMPGAVVTFDHGSAEPVLLLSAEDDPDPEKRRLRMPVSSCTVCGQHYFEHSLEDFSFAAGEPGGGRSVGGSIVWGPMDVAKGGTRILAVDRLISQEEGDATEHDRLFPLFFCRECGAAHREEGARCSACGSADGRVQLNVVQQKEDNPGYLSRCVCCGSNGRRTSGRFREPCKRVQAVNVADVHVLAQDMIHHAERRRLLVFADNRQDAAFQAGWMRDHARRFRLRGMMDRLLPPGGLHVGDLVTKLLQDIGPDQNLAFDLMPEVFQREPDTNSQTHQNERNDFLRLQVLLELTMSSRERIGLEPWGRLRVTYEGLSPSAPFIQEWASTLQLPAEEVLGGVCALLDIIRRKRCLHDPHTRAFTMIQEVGSAWLQNGYLPELRGVPKGVKLRRESGDDPGRVDQWVSATGHQTLPMEIAGKWGVPADAIGRFLTQCWSALAEIGILVPVTLQGSKGRALPNCHGVSQINLEKVRLEHNEEGFFRCKTCRRSTVRATPRMRCLGWRCDGELEHVPEDQDNYDLSLVKAGYTFLRPREHTAMVPHDQREQIENIFKGQSEAINTIVCTQTLEMGVDIGSLDGTLMRNVPPLPSNYWQRVGRAGRRHRMAVNLTYCRMVNHDRAYFTDPMKMLSGRVEAPSFNLSNELMVQKHVHATVLTTLNQMARAGSGLSDADREEIRVALDIAFPRMIRSYLFDDQDNVRPAPLDISMLNTVVTKHAGSLARTVEGVFTQGWPAQDSRVVDPARLSDCVLGIFGRLSAVRDRLFRRLRWALGEMARLERIRALKGTLDEENHAFYDRCRRFVDLLKGRVTGKGKNKNSATNLERVITYSVLAQEGFLPGYGLESGSITGYAEALRGMRGAQDFELPRPPSIALREYVPGNLIYANGQRFVPRRFMRTVEDSGHDLREFNVHVGTQSVRESGTGASSSSESVRLKAIPICDVNLVSTARISDEEDNRFQMGVFVFGTMTNQHSGGVSYRWGESVLQHCRGVRLRLVNAGAPALYKTRQELGYPVCRVCGQSVSTFSSDRQIEEFAKNHEEWCKQTPERIGFYADLEVHALILKDCANRNEAFSVLEGIRFAASDLLEMELEDLQIMVIGSPAGEICDGMLFDPMPGGSGLLDQLCARFPEVIAKARELADDCPGLCLRSCTDCFQTYRNASYHQFLDRLLLAKFLDEIPAELIRDHDIPPRQPQSAASAEERPVNEAERALKRLLLDAGFQAGRWQEQQKLSGHLGSTTPDVTFDDPMGDDRKIFVYLDGLSAHIHGNPATRQRDAEIRNDLRADGHEVVEIPVNHLDDKNAMVRVFKRLTRFLMSAEAIPQIAAKVEACFAPPAAPVAVAPAAHALPYRILPENARGEPWRDCVPLTSLKAAAGQFGPQQESMAVKLEWVEDWITWDGHPKFEQDMFVAQVVGQSMEPLIPDGSYCLFRRPGAGTRQNRVVLVWHSSLSDPQTGGSYTVKEYTSEKALDENGHQVQDRIVLKPKNPAASPIEITAAQEDEVLIVAEFVAVIK